MVVADARPFNLETVDSGDELGDRTDALPHVVEPAPADDAERHGLEPTEVVDTGAHGVGHDRLVRPRRDLRQRAVEVGQEQQMPPSRVPVNLRGDLERGCVVSPARSVVTTQRESPYLSGVPAC